MTNRWMAPRVMRHHQSMPQSGNLVRGGLPAPSANICSNCCTVVSDPTWLSSRYTPRSVSMADSSSDLPPENWSKWNVNLGPVERWYGWREGSIRQRR